jgi:hypothetical protein
MFAKLPQLEHDPIIAGDCLRFMLSFFLPIESTHCSGYPALHSTSLLAEATNCFLLHRPWLLQNKRAAPT